MGRAQLLPFVEAWPGCQVDRSQQKVSNRPLRDATRAHDAATREHVAALVGTGRHALRAFGTKRPWVRIPPPRQQSTRSKAVHDRVMIAWSDQLRDYGILFVWCFFCREAISTAPMLTGAVSCDCGSSHETEDRKAKPATLISRRALATTRSARRTPIMAGARPPCARGGSVRDSGPGASYHCDHLTPPMPTGRARCSNWSKRPRGQIRRTSQGDARIFAIGRGMSTSPSTCSAGQSDGGYGQDRLTQVAATAASTSTHWATRRDRHLLVPCALKRCPPPGVCRAHHLSHRCTARP